MLLNLDCTWESLNSFQKTLKQSQNFIPIDSSLIGLGWGQDPAFLKFPQVFPVCSPGWEVLPQAMEKLSEGFKQGVTRSDPFLTTCTHFNVQRILWLRRPLWKETLLSSVRLSLSHYKMKIHLQTSRAAVRIAFHPHPAKVGSTLFLVKGDDGNWGILGRSLLHVAFTWER